MQRGSWLTPAETRLAGLLFVLSVLGALVRCGERLSPEVERWLAEAGGPSPVSEPSRTDTFPGPPPVDPVPHVALGPEPEAGRGPAVGWGPASPGEGIDPNTARIPDLVRLPGVGPALAGRILEDRERNGPYRKAEDLLRVRGIGPATLDKMRSRLRF